MLLWETLLMIMPGVISLIFGLLCLFAASRITEGRKRSRAASWIDTDMIFLKHRVGVGLCLIVIGLFCLSSAWYVWLRLHQ